ncbi:MAG: hypothetical protein U0930_15135 [Pirellulales bacterium]
MMFDWISEFTQKVRFGYRLKAPYLRQIARWLQVPNAHVLNNNTLRFTTTGGVNVTVSPERDRLRITGHPAIMFHPRGFDPRFLVSLLFRNGETSLGAWQLVATEDRIHCSYTACVPVMWCTKRVLKRHIENVLEEIDSAWTRYKTLGTI